MGFEIPNSVVALEFEKYPGLEVSAETLSMGEILGLAGQAATLRADSGKVDDAMELVKSFTGRLRGWNCTRNGEPVPATHDGYLSMPAPFAAEILLAWYDANSGDDLDKGPLDQRSTNGSPSARAPFVPTEVL